nr:zinc finger BED domain-containing protein DAYSLEEPER-like [Tanacetum cinerariifolium]
MSVDSAGPIKQTHKRRSKTASVPVASDSAGPIKLTPKRRPKTASVPVAFDPDTCGHEIAQMIILHGYPLHMVEHKEFMAFLHNLQPKFNLLTVQDDCVATYVSERSTIENLIEQMPGRICLTLDPWNSNNTTGYIFIRGQFTDSEWNIRKRLLKVVMEPYPESDSAFTNAVSACLSDWNIKGRLFSVTLNQNQSLREISINGLRSLLSTKTLCILNGQLLLTNCLARSLTSIVQQALQVCEETVKKVRNCVKYVKTSEPIEDYFLGLKQQLNVLNTRTLSLDDQTKWNTTYEMLLAGIHGLFLEYATGDVPGYSSNGEWLTEFDAFIIKNRSQQFKSELDLEESLLPRIEFDVMGWWKMNESKYPVLSKMARDILTLPVSSDPESVFDTCVKEMDRYQCILRPEMVEALHCAKDWLCSEPIKIMESLVKMEFPI